MIAQVKYVVTIRFKGAKTAHTISSPLQIEYYMGRGRTDTFRFLKKKIVFTAYRSKVYSEEDILSHSNNTLNSQILKGIALFYANCLNFPPIKEISIVIHKSSVENTLCFGEFILGQKYNFKSYRNPQYHFLPNEELFKENPLGTSMRIALSHWLMSINSSDEHICFEHLWTAFNAIFSYFDPIDKQEIKKQAYIRDELKRQSAHFDSVSQLVKDYSVATLREFRWLLLFKNHLQRDRNADQLCKFMQRYNDKRILLLFSELITSKSVSSHITTSREYTNLLSKLEIEGTNEDMDIILLLCIKYAYFLRNQLFHGHTWSYIFRLGRTAEDKELAHINTLLTKLIMEILKTPNVLHQKTES